MEKWEMYMEIKQLKEQGFKIRRIARKLGISRTTVYKYLERSPQEMAAWAAATKTRTKILDPYELLIHTWLSENPDMSSAQIYDWLMEKYDHFTVGESTVRSYVRELREKYAIPKETHQRVYEAVPDPPMGQQLQVDFGKTNQKTPQGKHIKMYFITFVLSHSRYKYVEWMDRPFMTKDVIRMHEHAFQYFGGMPKELVYDQDAYREARKLNVYFCRKADPESKGRIERVVGFVKDNFAKNRVLQNIDQWNESCMAWLERTGNWKVHNTTKKRPIEVFTLEKHHLKPVIKEISISTVDSSITRTVRKDNTIIYESNRYSVPLGTYQKDKKVYIEITADNRLVIREQSEGPVIANHLITFERGKLIQDRQHTRDRTKGIGAYIATVSTHFTDGETATAFLEEIHQRYPRYMRDQLGIVLKVSKAADQTVRDEALRECMKRGVYSATEFSDVLAYIQRQLQQNGAKQVDEEIKALHDIDLSDLDTEPDTRELAPYLDVLKGAAV